MKIAIYSDTFSPQINGVANTAKNSARALGELGHEVRVYTVSSMKSEELTKHAQGFYKVFTAPSFAVPAYPGERLSLPLGFTFSNIHKWKPDIIHVHTPFSLGLEAILVAKIYKTRLLGTHHTFFDHYLKHVHLDYKWSRKLSWDLTVFFYNRMDMVISPTKSLRDELMANGLKKPVSVLSNSVDFQVFHSDNKVPTKETLKKKFGITGKSVVYMGRVSYEKSIDEVIFALAEVLKEKPEVKLMIVGDGPEKEKLTKLTASLGIKDNVIFTGFIQGQDLVEALSTNDLYVTASKSENMPLAVLEAMSVGLPIIAISSLGLAEIVEHNKNGFLLAESDSKTTIKEISKAILNLFTDEELRGKFGFHSAELSLKYSEKEITQKLVEIYKNVISSIK